jgi:hypothetical protein
VIYANQTIQYVDFLTKSESLISTVIVGGKFADYVDNKNNLNREMFFFFFLQNNDAAVHRLNKWFLIRLFFCRYEMVETRFDLC